MKRQVWLFILFLFLPSLSLAADLEKVDNKLVVQANQNQYRLRVNTKPFQLAAINGAVVEQFVVNADLFVQVDRSGEKFLLRSRDGLGYYPVPGLMEEPVAEYKFGRLLIVRTSNQLSFYNGSQFSTISEPVVGSKLDHYYRIDNQFYYLNLQDNRVEAFGLSDNGWNQIDGLDCLEITHVIASIPTVVCDGIIFQLATEGFFNQLGAAPVKLLSSSETVSVFAGRTDQSLVVLLTPNQLIEMTLPISSPITSAKIHNQRVFLRIENRFYELGYNRTTPELVPAPADGGELVPVEGADWLYLRSGNNNWLTSEYAAWQPVTVAVPYDRALKLSNGVALWKYDGADIQFSGDGLIFRLSNGSWARSAKFKALIEHGNEVFLLLLNSSSNPNLYRSTSLSSWSRVTFPTKPTYQLTIRQARQALPGTLLELSGVVTADQGLVSDEVFYLQDQTGGIQVFLSKTKGAIANVKNKRALVTGELSSSQTKRIIIDAPDEVLIGEPSAVTPVAVKTAEELQQRLGELLQLSGSAAEVGSDYLRLEFWLNRIKAHLLNVKDYLTKGDSIEFSAIVDWNAASGAVEAWVLPESVQVTKPLSTQAEPAQPQLLSPVAQKINQGTASKTKPSPAVVAAATKKITPINSQATKPPSPVQSTSNQQNNVTAMLSSIGLLLVSTGRRFQRFLQSLG